ncbi:MAG: acylphosphatase [Phycisphaerales bacterium]|nr:acylphosphatase [Phycisphaerales bacterium]
MRQRVRFLGRVQGVGFRATARTICRAYPVTGFVQNEPDGSVLLEIQGEPGVLELALTEIRSTMRRSIISEAALPLADVAGELDFTIRH